MVRGRFTGCGSLERIAGEPGKGKGKGKASETLRPAGHPNEFRALAGIP